MKKYVLCLVALLAALFCSTSLYAKSSKNKARTAKNAKELYMNLLVKQLDAQISPEGLLTVKYSNGSTLYYTILDNFGNVALTWDHSDGKTSYNQGVSAYKGAIEIPSFITIESKGDQEEDIVMSFNVCEIAENAFNGCSELTSVSIPYSVRNIRQNAFSDCDKLESINVNDNNNIYMSQDGILFSKSQNILILYPAQKQNTAYTVPEATTIICPNAFQNNSALHSIVITDNVTAISDYSFQNCSNLESISLGKSLRIIGKGAFRGCNSISEIRSANIFAPHNCPIVFERSIKATCKVVVPTGQTSNYKRRLEWLEFQNYVEE